MILDHFIMTAVATVFFLPGFISSFDFSFDISHEQVDTSDALFGFNYLLIYFIGFALYFCKDCFNGRSLAKRAVRIQVVDFATKLPASPLKTLVRNILIIIWPVEVIVTLFSPSRRIGDFIAGTEVVPYSNEPRSDKRNTAQILISFVLAYFIMVLLWLPFRDIEGKTDNKSIKYIESSYDIDATAKLISIYNDSLEVYLKPDIKIYNHIKGDESLKYISVILVLKNNLFDNETEYDKIKNKAINILVSEYQIGSFVGRMQFVYKQPGSMTTRTIPFDWREK